MSLPGEGPSKELRIANSARRQEWCIVHDEHRLTETRDGRRVEKGVDVDLACQAMEDAVHDKHDIYVIVSADSDFLPLVRRLQRLNRKVKIVGPYHATAREVGEDASFTNIFDIYPSPQVEQAIADSLDDAVLLQGLDEE